MLLLEPPLRLAVAMPLLQLSWELTAMLPEPPLRLAVVTPVSAMILLPAIFPVMLAEEAVNAPVYNEPPVIVPVQVAEPAETFPVQLAEAAVRAPVTARGQFIAKLPPGDAMASHSRSVPTLTWPPLAGFR